jgi:hypothetical protein
MGMLGAAKAQRGVMPGYRNASHELVSAKPKAHGFNMLAGRTLLAFSFVVLSFGKLHAC